MLVPNLIQLSLWVQSTHPCGVRRLSIQIYDLLIGFNPRTRVGCDQPVQIDRVEFDASIHAPVWGATRRRFRSFRCTPRFNPRTRVGCDTTHAGASRRRPSFNPCTRVGCDDVARGPCDEPSLASIHAPVWGATDACRRVQEAAELQSTHPCGVRHYRIEVTQALHLLQSTHPCGVRRQM